MTPLRVWAHNFRTYEFVEWTIPTGLTAITAHNETTEGSSSNGSGKSSLLELLAIGLYGPLSSWGDYLTLGGEETSCEVGIEFDHSGVRYLVRRIYDAKGRGKKTLDFQWWEDDEPPLPGWRPLTMESQAATQELIVSTIGMSEAMFTHSVFAAQGARHLADPSVPPRERKDLFAEALGLDQWDRLRKLVLLDVSGLNGELEALAARLGAFEEDIAAEPLLQAEHAELVALIATAARDLVEAEEAEKVVRARHEREKGAADRYATLLAQKTSAEAAWNGFGQKQMEAAAATNVVETANVEIARLQPIAYHAEALEMEAQELAAVAATRQAGAEKQHRYRASVEHALGQAEYHREMAHSHTVKIDEIQKQIGLMEIGEVACDRCGQPLAGEALLRAVETAMNEMQVYQERLERANKEVADAVLAAGANQRAADEVVIPELLDEASLEVKRASLRAARAAVSEIAVLRERIQQATALAAKVEGDDFRSQSAAAKKVFEEAAALLSAQPTPDPDALSLAARDLERAMTDVTIARAADREQQSALAASTERLKRVQELKGRVQEGLQARTKLNDRLEVLKRLERAYGRDGIPVLLLETLAIPQVEREAQSVLEQLGMPFRVELVTQRENKGGGLKDTLDVVVHEPNGARGYSTFSGGERTRIEFALRIGLARLIAQRSSSACGLLCLDEMTFLDSAGMASVIEVLRGLTEFRSVVLISHDDRLVDGVDQTVLVVRDESGSRLEVAA